MLFPAVNDILLGFEEAERLRLRQVSIDRYDVRVQSTHEHLRGAPVVSMVDVCVGMVLAYEVCEQFIAGFGRKHRIASLYRSAMHPPDTRYMPLS